MTRKEKVYKVLKDLTDELSLEDVKKGSSLGFDAETISDITDIDRSNVSRELNDLVREGRAIKIIGRPVLFLARESLETIIPINYEGDFIFETMADFLEMLGSENSELEDGEGDPFNKIIGVDGSLELAIKQAKAAILYPPRGLHTLITGPTGVGKTTFAEMMYKYAVYSGAISKDAEFIIFNCAEYADNPQLILSQLFGHVKGAFTGADHEKAGLVEKADGGILLLDEIHRLPPEGQEMLFLLMDKNVYRKLGETEGDREANVLIIGATTEDVNSTLLSTFLRRIPMVISLPSLDKRPLSERLEFIESFFIEEANNVKVPIKIYKDVLRAFLLYDCRGNIGQLKADIQLLCARGFLEYKTRNRKLIEIDTPLLPEHVYNGLLKKNKNREEIFALLDYEKDYYVYKESDKFKFTTIDNYNLSGNLYNEITNKYNSYISRGYSRDKISEIISNDIEKYIKRLLKKKNVDKEVPEKEELFKIISPRVYEAVQTALTFAKHKLERDFSNRTVIGLAMHISALMERLDSGNNYYSEELNKIAINNPDEFRTAKIIREILQQELEISIPKEEIGFLTMFLSAVDLEESHRKIGVIVLAHGDSTASSIANVVNNLLGTNHCKAIDMPLDAKVEDVLEKTIEMAKEVDEGKGVLLLVDMGSLTAFSEIIYKKTNIVTSSIENISTPVVIEAVRKSLLPEMTLSMLVEELKTATPYIGRLVGGGVKNKADISEPKLILTTCISGKGAAVKIAQLLENTLPFIEEQNIKIKPIDIDGKFNIDKVLEDEEKKNIIAVVGTIDLTIPGVPFIPIDELIIGDGIKILEKNISGLNRMYFKERVSEDNMLTKLLEKILSFLNPEKAYNLANKSFITLTNLLKLDNSDQIKVRYIIHCCCMIERLIQKEALPYKDIEELIEARQKVYRKIRLSLASIEETFGFKVPDTEIGYIIELIDTQ
ncbi:sigma 54-interacting transcriptional regulator [Tepidimicrobium xylanilyticum]|uniref:sigma 54-interacting transcriptional regulator n=1 Tax=Tepidimicrobium xylanilyticum TaxID=1123352 RepID=UPI00264EC431|nr:sigma-54-dependent transcriptional regulator [Tepidimicrobium xylanilyticum]GMG95342.1 transcriptional regulator [Tepidimicrobium xylanilyticum]